MQDQQGQDLLQGRLLPRGLKATLVSPHPEPTCSVHSPFLSARGTNRCGEQDPPGPPGRSISKASGPASLPGASVPSLQRTQRLNPDSELPPHSPHLRARVPTLTAAVSPAGPQLGMLGVARKSRALNSPCEAELDFPVSGCSAAPLPALWGPPVCPSGSGRDTEEKEVAP